MKHKAHYVNFADIDVPKFDFNNLSNYFRWVPYGDDNLFPEMLKELTEKSVTHASMINTLSNAIAGDGFERSERADWLKENAERSWGTDFLQLLASDFALYGSFAIQVVYRRDKQGIAKLHHIPSDYVRVSKNLDGYYVCPEWSNYQRAGVQFYNKYDLTKAEQGTQLLYVKQPNFYTPFYSVPRYTSAINWIALEGELSRYYLSTMTNAALPSVAITVPEIADDEEKDEFYKEYAKYYQGAENAGRFMLLFDDPSVDKSIKVETINSGLETTLFEHYVTEARQQILTAHNATSPVLASVPKNGSLGGDGAEIEQAWKMYNRQTASQYHRVIEDVLNDVTDFVKQDFDKELKIKPYLVTTKEEDNQNDN